MAHQDVLKTVLLDNVTADTTSTREDVSGWDRIYVDVENKGVNTGSLTIKGVTESGHAFNCGVRRYDEQLNPVRSVSSISIVAHSQMMFVVEDFYPELEVVYSGAAGVDVNGLTVIVYAIPQ